MMTVKVVSLVVVVGVVVVVGAEQRSSTQTSLTLPAPPLNLSAFPDNTTALCGKINSAPCNLTENYYIYINSSFICNFSCRYTYNTTEGIKSMKVMRLEVTHRSKHPTQHHLFVTVQQDAYLNSWTLPILFDTYGNKQPFKTIEPLLCPPVDRFKSGDIDEVLNFTITTRSSDDVVVQFTAKEVPYALQRGDNVNVTVTTTPVSPWYKFYQWEGNEQSVLVTADVGADSKDKNASHNVCAILALQNAECPVTSDETGLQNNRGRYQTFTTGAGMIARRDEFPSGIHIIVLSLPDDDPCSFGFTSADNPSSSRKKSVVLQVFPHATIWSSWYIYLLTGGVVGLVIIGLTVFARILISRTLASEEDGEEDERPLVSASRDGFMVAEAGAAFITGVSGQGTPTAAAAPGTRNSLPSHDGDMEEEEEQRFTGMLGASGTSGNESVLSESTLPLPLPSVLSDRSLSVAVVDSPAFLPVSTYAPNQRVISHTNHTFNPRVVMWWKLVAMYEERTAQAHVAEIGFQNNLLLMGVFAFLPTTELVRYYVKMMAHHGMEDECFFNSRCLTALGSIADFSRVFTNIGYVLTGICFTYIVSYHKKLTHKILAAHKGMKSVGVSRHYGLFTSLGYGLVLQGVMSALYHACPNSVTIRFDMMYMYVMLVAAVVSLWGLRHGDVTHHVYPTMFVVGASLVAAEGRQWVGHAVFWGTFDCLYSLLLLPNAILMARYGIWSFSPYKMWQAWQGWRPVVEKLRSVLQEEDRSSQPLQVVRVVVGIAANLGLLIYGPLADPNIYSYILTVCLLNTSLYFLNYVLAKVMVARERGTVLAWSCLVVSLVLWVMALIAFNSHSTDSEASPASSRAQNSPCTFLGVYDAHDIWHILSAIGLFTFYLSLLTLDDDLCCTPSKSIKVF